MSEEAPHAGSDLSDHGRQHKFVAAGCGLFVMMMVGASYAAVPLYKLFCQTTGFAGTPVRATAGPSAVADRAFEIRFDSNVNGVPWRFQPEAASVSVKAGAVTTIYYKITNAGPSEVTALASYNVTPEAAAPYFSKIQCFCFSAQTLKGGQTLELPVVFFVDPAISEDKQLDSIASITLSYTFFPAEQPAKPIARAGTAAEKSK